MGIFKAALSRLKIAFSEVGKCRHGEVQCGQCAQDWHADGEGIGPIIPRHDRPQRGVMPTPK